MFLKKLKSIFSFQLLIVGYFPIIVFSFIIFFQTKNILEKKVYLNLLENAKHTSSLVETFLFRNVSTLNEFTNSALIFKSESSHDLLLNEMSKFSELHSEIESLSMFNEKGQLIISTEPIFTITEHYKIKSTLKPIISDVIYKEKNESYVFIIQIPLFYNNNFFGTFLAEYNLKSVWEITNSLYFGETGKTILLNSKGQYIGGVQNHLLLKDFTPSFMINNIINHKPNGEILKFKTVNNKEYICAIYSLFGDYKTFQSERWKILPVIDAKESFYVIYIIKNFILVSIPLILIVIFIFSSFTSNLILKPLKLLFEGTIKAATGNFDFKTNIQNPDEIKALSKNFDYMIEKLNQAHTQLKNEIIEKEKAEINVRELNKNLEEKIIIRTKEILDLKEFHENILSSLTVGVIVLDSVGRVIFLNPKGEFLLKIKMFDILNKKVEETYIYKDFSLSLLKSLNTKKNEEGLELIIKKESSTCIFGLKTSLLLKNDDSPNGIIGVFNDITERKQMEQEIIESEKMFSCGLLSTGMAHDFNNILNRIQMGCQIMENIAIDDTILSTVKEIEDSVNEGQSITKSLMAFSKHEPIALVPVDLLSVLKNFEQKAVKSCTNSEILLTIECPKSAKVMAEPNYLMQIFMNLFHNSLQAMPSIKGEISIKVLISNDISKIYFKDNGPGINKETLDRIFEPFYSTKTITKNSGWGLGLALTKSLIQKMNGHIAVESIPYKETVFIITLKNDDRKN